MRRRFSILISSASAISLASSLPAAALTDAEKQEIRCIALKASPWLISSYIESFPEDDQQNPKSNYHAEVVGSILSAAQDIAPGDREAIPYVWSVLPTALAAIKVAISGETDDVSDAASRILNEWGCSSESIPE